MRRAIYFVVILMLLAGCNSGGSNHSKSVENNQSFTDNIDKNQTLVNDIDSLNNEDIKNNIVDKNQTVNRNNLNNEIDRNQTISDITNNITSPNNEDINNENDKNQTIVDNINPPITKKSGKAQLGVLSKATVKLYELNGVEKKLLATELTSSGESVEDIGNFNLYLEKLEDNKLYLYEVSGGEDYDVDDDGVVDTTPTPNMGTFHLLVLGSHIKALKRATISIVSEIIYQKLLSSLGLNISDTLVKMESFAKEIIQEDINGDGFIGIEDVLKYNPVLDKSKLYLEYQNKIDKVINDIINNREFDLVAPIFKNISSKFTINENLKFVEKIEIVDDSKLTVLLSGEDANKFKYNLNTQELSLIKKADFKNPHDQNRDNIFKLTIEAIDSYFNSTKKEFSIEIVDVNETTPQVPILDNTNLSIYENSDIDTLMGTVVIKNQGSDAIKSFTLLGEDSQLFKINNQGQIFSLEVFDYEKKSSYIFQVEATNSVGKSSKVDINIQIKDTPDIKPSIQDVSIDVLENRPINTYIGKVNIVNKGDSNISNIKITGYRSNDFQVSTDGDIKVVTYLDYESYNLYYLQYTATNKAGESEPADLTVRVENIYENSGSDYPRTESGIQKALDNGDYSFVINQLLNNRDAYSGLDDDSVNMNIAGAYVGSSGYTIFDITGAMSDGNQSSFNDFVKNVTKDNNALDTINKLNQADIYYSKIVQGVNCSTPDNLTKIQKDSCYNLGLVRLTSLTNSVKLLFGGDSTTVQKWANGVDINSSDDLNGNGVLDASEASACAIVYANNPNDSCKDGTFYSYRGAVNFKKNGREYKLTLIDIDVGNSINGYQNFYKLISSNANNNTPILTSGVCNTNFNITTHSADGESYFPCPVIDSNGDVMGIKQSLESSANIQSLFPNGDTTRTTIESYIKNITGSTSGTIGLDNLSTYLKTH